MCGIVGLYLKNSGLTASLGSMFAPMLVELTDRGPDSAGFAVYHEEVEAGLTKFTLFHPDPSFDWQSLADAVTARTSASAGFSRHDSHAVLIAGGDAGLAAAGIEDFDPGLQIMSAGSSIEIYKEMGTPGEVAGRFRLAEMAASHMVGHTRMATESAVTTAGSHPFSTGRDLCLVHNGSLSNHNRLRQRLRDHEGMIFKTDNDTEVGAAYLTSRLAHGRTLHQALEDCLTDLDGFFTFVAGTREGFAVLRDPYACKPAVLAETDDYVAFGSEYRALAGLPGVDQAAVWEPEPAVVYSWGSA